MCESAWFLQQNLVGGWEYATKILTYEWESRTISDIICGFYNYPWRILQSNENWEKSHISNLHIFRAGAIVCVRVSTLGWSICSFPPFSGLYSSSRNLCIPTSRHHLGSHPWWRIPICRSVDGSMEDIQYITWRFVRNRKIRWQALAAGSWRAQPAQLVVQHGWEIGESVFKRIFSQMVTLFPNPFKPLCSNSHEYFWTFIVVVGQQTPSNF